MPLFVALDHVPLHNFGTKKVLNTGMGKNKAFFLQNDFYLLFQLKSKI